MTDYRPCPTCDGSGVVPLDGPELEDVIRATMSALDAAMDTPPGRRRRLAETAVAEFTRLTRDQEDGADPGQERRPESATPDDPERVFDGSPAILGPDRSRTRE